MPPREANDDNPATSFAPSLRRIADGVCGRSDGLSAAHLRLHRARHDHRAKFALDVTKRFGKRFKIIYNKDAGEFAQERESIDWLNRTRKFIYKDMITPYYQPIVDVSTRRIYKYEALARVIDGDEVISPYKFLNAAKRLGLLTSITKSMINKTFEQFSGTDTRFSINITERDIIPEYAVEIRQSV